MVFALGRRAQAVLPVNQRAPSASTARVVPDALQVLAGTLADHGGRGGDLLVAAVEARCNIRQRAAAVRGDQLRPELLDQGGFCSQFER